MASWLLRSTPELRLRALAGDIVLCSRVRQLTLTVPLSTHLSFFKDFTRGIIAILCLAGQRTSRASLYLICRLLIFFIS